MTATNTIFFPSVILLFHLNLSIDYNSQWKIIKALEVVPYNGVQEIVVQSVVESEVFGHSEAWQPYYELRSKGGCCECLKVGQGLYIEMELLRNGVHELQDLLNIVNQQNPHILDLLYLVKLICFDYSREFEDHLFVVLDFNFEFRSVLDQNGKDGNLMTYLDYDSFL